MPKSAPRHVAKPASEQTVVERWNAERTLQEQIPKVHDQICANTNGNCTKDVVCFNAQDLPRHGCCCLTPRLTCRRPRRAESSLWLGVLMVVKYTGRKIVSPADKLDIKTDVHKGDWLQVPPCKARSVKGQLSLLVRAAVTLAMVVYAILAWCLVLGVWTPDTQTRRLLLPLEGSLAPK